MKKSAKRVFGVTLSIAWFAVYVGGGAFLLARRATANLDHVAAYIPFVIFFWIVAFFVGHSALEKFFLILFPAENSSLGHAQYSQTRDIDNIRLANKPTYEKKVEAFYSQNNWNVKKETGKIPNSHQTNLNIYKFAQHC